MFLFFLLIRGERIQLPLNVGHSLPASVTPFIMAFRWRADNDPRTFNTGRSISETIFPQKYYIIASKINREAKWSTLVQFTFNCHKDLRIGTVPLNVTASSINMQYVMTFADDILTLFWKFTDILGDNCIQNFHLGRYIVGYTSSDIRSEI